MNIELQKILKIKIIRLFYIAISLYYVAIVITTRSSTNYFDPTFMIENSFSTLQWLPILLILITAISFSMNYQYGVFKNDLYRVNGRIGYLLKKIAAIISITIVTYLAITILDFIVATLLFNDYITTIVINGTLLWILGSFIENIMISLLVMLLTIMFRNAVLPICIGILYYLLVNLLGGAMSSLIDKAEVLKWNPLNMLNFKAELINSSIKNLTHLSLLEILIAIVGYSLFYLFFALFIFRYQEL